MSNETVNPFFRVFKTFPFPTACVSFPAELLLLLFTGGGEESSVACSVSEAFLLLFLLLFSILVLDRVRIKSVHEELIAVTKGTDIRCHRR